VAGGGGVKATEKNIHFNRQYKCYIPAAAGGDSIAHRLAAQQLRL
jgi:hypothetical protein